MRVITWNMRRAKTGSPSWDYFNDIDPDVALSRVRSLSDIYVSEGNFTNEIIKLPDQKVIDFMKYFNFLNA